MKKITLGAVIIGAIALQGCQTTDPYTGEARTSRATTGAAIGAGVGALVGIATSDSARERRQRALAGAGIGAIAGGGVGHYMDVQERELREKLAGSGVSVTRDGDNIILNMPGNVTFDTDAYQVKSQFMPVLDSVAEVLREYKSTMIQVAGHTDSTGSVQYNMLLSQQRAQSVANALAGYGVEQVRMDIVGFGPHQPAATNDTAAGRAQNRRVELTLLPYTR